MKKMKQCLIIYNPNSGKGIPDSLIENYKTILNEHGYKVDIVATKRTNHATETIVKAKNYDIVFSIGGDGTLNEIVKGNYERKNKLTICPLPSGTCNDVASMLGYGKNPIENLKLALDGEVCNMDIGTINDNPFTYVVGVGRLLNVPYETKSVDKHKTGYFAYLKEGAQELLQKMKKYRTEVTIDGKKLDGEYSLIMVSNADHIAGIDHFYKDVCLNDGEMEVLLCKAGTKRAFINCFLKFFMGHESKNLISLKAHDVKIKFIDKPDKNWCIDGEKLSSDSKDIHIIVGERMNFLTPKQNVKRLFKSL